MTISDIYETALYLGEKTDDSTGYIDDEYKKQHKMKALEIIKQCIIKTAALENVELIHPENTGFDTEVRLPLYLTKVVIPAYTAAVLCLEDGEENKYDLLISEYQNALSGIKHSEETVEAGGVLEGLV